MKKILIFSIATGSLDLIGACSLEQKAAFNTYLADEKKVRDIIASNKYEKAVELLIKKAELLAQKFPTMNLFEIKRACDTAYRLKDFSQEIADFVRFVIYPLRIRKTFEGPGPERAVAEKLFHRMIELGLFVEKDLDQLIATSITLINLKDGQPLNGSLLIPYLWQPFLAGPKDLLVFTEDQSTEIFSKILLPFAKKNGPLKDTPFHMKFLRDLFEISPSLKAMSTGGKAPLQDLFAPDTERKMPIDSTIAYTLAQFAESLNALS